MNPENDKYLVEKYPLLYWQRYMPMQATAMCWGFECDDGWFELIDELSERIYPLVIEFNKNYGEDECERFAVVQVKEKYGGLRYYTNYHTDAIQDIIDEYEDRSYHICELCGEPGFVNSGGWLQVRCEKHLGERNL